MKTAVLIPCYNEEMTIGKVIDDFRRELPEAEIYVFNNASTDKTKEVAEEHGAFVVEEPRKGKGNVVRSMFRSVDADLYVMADGDDTYPADEVKKLIKPVVDQEADMCIGDRISNKTYEKTKTRPFHSFGNNLVTILINKLFRADLTDIMTGYRVFNKRFVKCMPVLSEGFEIETEMSLFALHHKIAIKEIPINYGDRPEGSESKLNTFADGFKVLLTIFRLYKDFKPLAFFLTFFIISAAAGIGIGIPIIIEFINTGLVPKLPSAVLSTGLMILSGISFSIGVILDSIVKHHQQQYQITFNQFKD